MELYDIGSARFEAHEIGEIEAIISVEDSIFAPGKELQKYRFSLKRKRRELMRSSMEELIQFIDEDVLNISKSLGKYKGSPSLMKGTLKNIWASLEGHIGQVATIFGSTPLPSRWFDLLRHMRFGELHDLDDIIHKDWPIVKKVLQENSHDENEPIRSEVEDLSVLVATRPKGGVPKQLKWDVLTDRDFERLIFMLISGTDGYENPQWLMDTNAPDKGRDISVYRVIKDPLTGTLRFRVIIQCKHWQSKSVSVSEIQTLQAQMRLWEPPRIDIHIITTTGRFTADAVTLIEKENQGDRALMIEMWPESHLEKLLAARPDLIAHFKLR
jgi:hypothetical protein